jgi:hypothetical protein
VSAAAWGGKWEAAVTELRRLFGDKALSEADAIADGLHLFRGHGAVILWEHCHCRRDALVAAHAIAAFSSGRGMRGRVGSR